MDKDAILLFGVGDLQKSLIERCKLKNLFVVGIDPQSEATCRDIVSAFEVVDGHDFEKTIEVAEHYQVKGIITAATDKPLVMMSRVAEKLQLPFFSVETAEWSTDKLLMKKKFQDSDIKCAKGFLLKDIRELENLDVDYPIIVKPRDNSGSRGVIYCKDSMDVESAVHEALQFTRKGDVLIEEFIEGKEYSVESIHYQDASHVIQITEKITTAFPYNVELGHIQPAELDSKIKKEVEILIINIAKALDFKNCASHTEIKINNNGIYVIEASPRLGGDFITSHLTPLSTGVNMEDLLINIAFGKTITYKSLNFSSLVLYFNFSAGVRLKKSIKIDEIRKRFPYINDINFSLKKGDYIGNITNSLNRYGYFIISGIDKQILLKQRDEIVLFIEENYIEI